MLIAFWSKLKGQAGVSSNMLITSLLASVKYKMRVMACSSQINDLSLERALVPNLDSYIGETLNNYGFEPMMRYAKNGLLSLDNFSDFALPLVRNLHYDLFMGTQKTNKSDIEREKREELMLQILELSKKKYELSFVDLENGSDSELSLKIMKLADLIVLNINQNSLALEETKKSSIIEEHQKKIVYLLGRYEDGIRMNKKNIGRKFGFKPLVVIPYMPQLIDIENRGDLVEFIGRAANNKSYMKNVFFQEANKAVETIIHFTKGD